MLFVCLFVVLNLPQAFCLIDRSIDWFYLFILLLLLLMLFSSSLWPQQAFPPHVLGFSFLFARLLLFMFCLVSWLTCLSFSAHFPMAVVMILVKKKERIIDQMWTNTDFGSKSNEVHFYGDHFGIMVWDLNNTESSHLHLWTALSDRLELPSPRLSDFSSWTGLKPQRGWRNKANSILATSSPTARTWSDMRPDREIFSRSIQNVPDRSWWISDSTWVFSMLELS